MSVANGRRYDHAVVGAGPMGASAAKYLASAGARVALVAPGHHTTGDHRHSSHADVSRIARALDPDPVWATLGRRSIERYRSLEASTGIDFFSRVGSLLVLEEPAPDGRPGTSDPAAFDAAGTPYEHLDARALERCFPYLDLGRDAVGLFERDAGIIDPRRFVDAQIATGVQHGLEVLRVPMESVAPGPTGHVVGLTDGTTLQAGRVLLALGAYSRFDPACAVADRLVVYGRTIIHVEVPAGFVALSEGMPALRIRGREHGFYLVPPTRYPDGRWYLKIGGGPRTETLDSPGELEDWCRGDGDRAVAELLTAQVHRLFPDLTPVAVRRQTCIITVPDGGYPYITGGADGIGVVTGGNGAGAKSGDELGRLAAEMISGRPGWADGYPGQPFTPAPAPRIGGRGA